MRSAKTFSVLVPHILRSCGHRNHRNSLEITAFRHFFCSDSSSSRPPLRRRRPGGFSEFGEDNWSSVEPGMPIVRPSNREESRYLRDVTPAAPPHASSDSPRVAPLPDDRNREKDDEEAKKQEADIGRRDQDSPEFRLAKFTAVEKVEVERLPYPKLAPPIDKTPKPTYDLLTAIGHVKANAKFDETVEAHVRLGIPLNRSDMRVRGAAALPHGLGKSVTVVVFADGDDANEAKEAGADIVGADDLINQIKEGEFKVDFNICIATPELMLRLGKIGRILGPKGMMPNPKSGTVTSDVAKAVKEAKAGRIDIKTDDQANVHVCLGKTRFRDSQLYENTMAFVTALLAAKPTGLKSTSKYAGYIQRFTLCSTQGPPARVSLDSLSVTTKKKSKVLS